MGRLFSRFLSIFPDIFSGQRKRAERYYAARVISKRIRYYSYKNENPTGLDGRRPRSIVQLPTGYYRFHVKRMPYIGYLWQICFILLLFLFNDLIITSCPPVFVIMYDARFLYAKLFFKRDVQFSNIPTFRYNCRKSSGKIRALKNWIKCRGHRSNGLRIFDICVILCEQFMTDFS